MKKGNGKMNDREFGVILEKIYSEFRIFGEKLNAVGDKVDATFEEVGRQKEELFMIKTDIRIIKKDVAEIKTTLEGHEKRLAHLEIVK